MYRQGHPQPADVLLLVEVADSSLRHDRDVKIPLYARAGILEVWLVDVERCAVTTYRGPTPEGYESDTPVEAGMLIPVAAPHFAISVTDLFPPR